jgi:hypothetical protein
VAGVSISGTAYPALALTVIGVGLVAGAWVGRARWLIPVGLALCIGLAAGTASTRPERFGGPPGDQVIRPSDVSELQRDYEFQAGDATLDLTALDFTGTDVALDASLQTGQLQVILPPNVDVDIQARIQVGDARVLSEHWGGFSGDRRTVTDSGADGPGKGGHLVLRLSVQVGNLEVMR